MIYANVFEAIRALSPEDPVLYMKDRAGKGKLVRKLTFEAFGTERGDTVILPRTGLNILFYRGQADASWQTIPSIYRDATSETILIDSIKLLDFAMASERFPQVKFAQSQGVRVDTLALAQHYGLRTNMLDLTSDIAVAAFFATTKLQGGEFVPVDEGTGSISRILYLIGMTEDGEVFRPIGLQPFQRPGHQCAFGVKLEKGQALEDFQQGVTLSFHQERACGQAFLDLFGAKMPNCLFPREIIAQIGTKIRKGSMVTQAAIDAYCEAHGVSAEAVAQILKNYGVSTCKKTAFYPSPRQLAQEQMQVMKHGAFGGEIVFSRMMLIPEE